MRALPGPVLADVAANVLAMTLMVLIALGRMLGHVAPAAPPEVLVAQPVQPLGGAAAVELLRQRLLSGVPGLADLDPDTGDLPAPVSVLFILDPTQYPAVLPGLVAQGGDWRELTVPRALKTDDNRWHPDFLALSSLAPDPDRFRIALEELLIRRHAASGADNPLSGLGPSAGNGKGQASLALRFGHWFQSALDLLGLTALCAALWGLLRLRRWALTA